MLLLSKYKRANNRACCVVYKHVVATVAYIDVTYITIMVNIHTCYNYCNAYPGLISGTGKILTYAPGVTTFPESFVLLAAATDSTTLFGS